MGGCRKHLSSYNVRKYWDIPTKQVGELPLVYGPPVCIVWYKPIPGIKKWKVYKTISSADQIFKILNLLGTDMYEMFKGKSIADMPKSQAHAEAFKGDQMLSFIYHKPRPNIITIRNMEIKICDGMLVWPAGQSEAIYKIFEKQKEWNYQELMDERYYKRYGYYPGTIEPESTEESFDSYDSVPMSK